MKSFSATDAALEGFRITRENPKAFLHWVGFSFIVSALSAVVTASLPAEVRSALVTLQSDTTPSAAQLLETLVAVSPLVIFGLAIQCTMAAAVYRIIFRHDDTRFGYLRLGADELRLMALTLIYLGFAIGLLVAVVLVAAVVITLASFAGSGVAIFIGVIAELFALGLVVYIAVRLSLAPVATFAERRLALFESWRLTRGHFWRLFFAYVLAICCMVVIVLLTLVLFMAAVGIVVLATGGQLGDVGAMINPDDTTIRAYLTPAMIAYMVVGSVVTSLYYAVIAAPGAVAYQHLHGDPALTGAGTGTGTGTDAG